MLKRRDPAAMAALYDRYGRIVYSVILRIVLNVGEAEEVVQETFFRIWSRAHLVNDSCATLIPWILVIARNLAIDHLRAANGRSRCFERWGYDCLPSPISLNHFSDQAAQLRRAVLDLTLEQRTVIEFAYFEGLSQTEIADRMKMPLGTVKTWTRRALGNLRKSFAMVAEDEASDSTNGPRAGKVQI